MKCYLIVCFDGLQDCDYFLNKRKIFLAHSNGKWYVTSNVTALQFKDKYYLLLKDSIKNKDKSIIDDVLLVTVIVMYRLILTQRAKSTKRCPISPVEVQFEAKFAY